MLKFTDRRAIQEFEKAQYHLADIVEFAAVSGSNLTNAMGAMAIWLGYKLAPFQDGVRNEIVGLIDQQIAKQRREESK